MGDVVGVGIGAGTAIVGVLACPETGGVGCGVAAGGAGLAAYSFDNAKSDWRSMLTGRPAATTGGTLLSSVTGLDQNRAEMIYAVPALFTGFGSEHGAGKIISTELRIAEKAPALEKAVNAGSAVAKAKSDISVTKEVTLSRSIHGEAALHADDAIKAGKPEVLTIARPGAPANRQASTGLLEKVPGKHLDEYPPAMFKEGGAGASVRPINPRDNMSAGACIGNACRGLPNGARVKIKIGD